MAVAQLADNKDYTRDIKLGAATYVTTGHKQPNADFYLLVDDDTYVRMHKLEQALKRLDPDQPFVAGHFIAQRKSFHKERSNYIRVIGKSCGCIHSVRYTGAHTSDIESEARCMLFLLGGSWVCILTALGGSGYLLSAATMRTLLRPISKHYVYIDKCSHKVGPMNEYITA